MSDNANAVTKRFEEAEAEDRANANRGKGFVKWEEPDTYIAGEIAGLWTWEDTTIVNVVVDDLTAPVYAKRADGENEEVKVYPDDVVCVSMGNAQLKDSVTGKDVGRKLLILYKGTEKTKKGNTLKLFRVMVIPARESTDEAAA